MVFCLVILFEVVIFTALVVLLAKFGRKKVERCEKLNTKVESRGDKNLKMFQ